MHWVSPVQSSSFLSSGSKVNFLTSPLPAEVATNSATSRISSSLSLSLNAGMVPPPFRTWRSTRSAFGRTSSRFGPTVAVAPAASSVWQPPQFASAKTLAPPEAATPVSVDSLSPPPQPADSEKHRGQSRYSRAMERSHGLTLKRKTPPGRTANGR